MSTLVPSSLLSQRSRSRCQNSPCFQRAHDLHVVQSDDVMITRRQCEHDGLRNGGLNGCHGACAPGCLDLINKASHNSSWSTSLIAEEWKHNPMTSCIKFSIFCVTLTLPANSLRPRQQETSRLAGSSCKREGYACLAQMGHIR